MACSSLKINCRNQIDSVSSRAWVSTATRALVSGVTRVARISVAPTVHSVRQNSLRSYPAFHRKFGETQRRPVCSHHAPIPPNPTPHPPSPDPTAGPTSPRRPRESRREHRWPAPSPGVAQLASTSAAISHSALLIRTSSRIEVMRRVRTSRPPGDRRSSPPRRRFS